MRIPLASWKSRARQLKADAYALYLARRDRRVPWYAKALALLVVAYAFSPIDLIPDFIPVLGYLDDVILVPLGIALAIKLIPAEVWDEHRERARLRPSGKPRSLLGAGAVLVLWGLASSWLAWQVGRLV